MESFLPLIAILSLHLSEVLAKRQAVAHRVLCVCIMGECVYMCVCACVCMCVYVYVCCVCMCVCVCVRVVCMTERVTTPDTEIEPSFYTDKHA